MKLIVGLGNPGEKYAITRHNVGFMVADRIGKDSEWEKKSALLSIICKLNSDVLLAKPQTFMNNSGDAVKKLVDWYKVKPENLYVIHDDLDIKLGEYKTQKGKGPKVHNGILSIEERLGATDFWRVRVGVDNRTQDNRTPGEQYVLEQFSNEELKVVQEVINNIVTKLKIRNSNISKA